MTLEIKHIPILSRSLNFWVKQAVMNSCLWYDLVRERIRSSKTFEIFARRRKFVASSELTSVKKSDHALLLIVINACNNRLTPLVKIRKIVHSYLAENIEENFFSKVNFRLLTDSFYSELVRRGIQKRAGDLSSPVIDQNQAQIEK